MLSFQKLDVYRCAIEFLALTAQAAEQIPRGKRHVAGSVAPRGEFDFPPHRGSGWPYRSGRCRADLRNRSRVCDGVRG
ncbi:MAG TPA: hypothetical protein VII08_09160, partial [Myxococcales bacterium]